MPVNQQIAKFIDSMNLKKGDLARKLETSHTTVNNIYKGVHSPKSDLLEKLLEAYPDLNGHWLLTGEGNMWKEGAGDHINQSNVGTANSNRVNKQVGMNGDLASCLEKVELLEKMVKDKEELIELLKKK